MSRESEYRARAAALKVRAATTDHWTGEMLRQVAEYWLLLASIEARFGGPATRWKHDSASAPSGVYKYD